MPTRALHPNRASSTRTFIPADRSRLVVCQSHLRPRVGAAAMVGLASARTHVQLLRERVQGGSRPSLVTSPPHESTRALGLRTVATWASALFSCPQPHDWYLPPLYYASLYSPSPLRILETYIYRRPQSYNLVFLSPAIPLLLRAFLNQILRRPPWVQVCFVMDLCLCFISFDYTVLFVDSCFRRPLVLLRVHSIA
jgi:hypothetical protein